LVIKVQIKNHLFELAIGTIMSRFAVWLYAALLALLAVSASGQNYPNKPIRVVTGDPGGAPDVAARLVAQGLTRALGHQFVVDNRGGASGIIAAQTVARALPDGYTLLFYGPTLWLTPLFIKKLPYDPLTDFSRISQTNQAPYLLVLHPSVPVHGYNEFITLIKARPGEFNFGSGGVGSSPHLTMELFRTSLGLDMLHVPYKGSGPAVIGLLAGHVQVLFASPAAVASHIKVGKLKGLAVTSLQPTALYPDLPTIAASGLPGYESSSIAGLFGPARMPFSLINRLNKELVGILAAADVKERFNAIGIEPMHSSPEVFTAKIKSEMEKWGRVTRAVGIQPD